MEIFNQLNWVDVLLFGIAIRIIFVGIKRGIVVEIFKLVGALFTVLITLHYCSSIAAFLHEKLRFPEGGAQLIAFGFLWALVAIAFKFIRDGFLILLRVEAHSAFDKWGSLFVAAGRAALVGSLTLLFLKVADVEYLDRNIEKSFTGSRLVKVSPRIYETSYEGFISKFFPSEKLNKEILTAGHTYRDREDREKEKK